MQLSQPDSKRLWLLILKWKTFYFENLRSTRLLARHTNLSWCHSCCYFNAQRN